MQNRARAIITCECSSPTVRWPGPARCGSRPAVNESGDLSETDFAGSFEIEFHVVGRRFEAVLSDEFADAAARRRFQREARTASSLNHPHILTVYDAGESEGRQYLVTEYIDDGTLKDWANPQGSKVHRTWREIVELLVGGADALR